jgi:RNA polymerase sigma-70 factor (ECF subfamily)
MTGTGQQRASRSAAAQHQTSGAPRSEQSALAAEIKALMIAGNRNAARDRFADLVALQQRRAARIAYHYLRDVHDADEAVQDAFVKVFAHIASYREELSFEVWFTRILVNGCLDLCKARARRLRWVLPSAGAMQTAAQEAVAPHASPEDRLLATERQRRILAAVATLPDRQREVFTLCTVAEQTTAEVSEALQISEATVRVHLFRAVHKLREYLGRPA